MGADWGSARFGDICEHSAFGPRFSGQLYKSGGNVATLRTTDISEDGKIEYRTMPFAELELEKFRHHFLQGNDLVITRSGRVGTVAVFDRFPKPVLPGAFLIRFRLDRKVADPTFYKYFFNSPVGQELVLSTASGSVQQNLNITSLHQLEVPLPPLSDQIAIAKILGALDKKVDVDQQVNETLERMARALFKSWFVDFDPVRAKVEGRDPGLPKYLADLFPNTFENSELGEVPKNWKIRTLGDVTSYLSRGISPAYIEEGGILVLNQKCVRNGRVDETRGRRHDASKKSIEGRTLAWGDILVNSTGVGTLGRVAQVLSLDEETIVDSHVTVVRADGVDASWNFLGLALRGRETEIEALGEGSTGQTELSRSRLATLSIVVPEPGVMAEFDRLCLPLRTKTVSNERSNHTLVSIRDALLPKLISGELRLANAELIVGGQM